MTKKASTLEKSKPCEYINLLVTQIPTFGIQSAYKNTNTSAMS